MIGKIFMVIILILLPISLFSQYSMYNVNGWSYGGAWGTTDTLNTGMKIVEGPTPDDSVMTFKNAGWTSQPIGNDWALQNSFVKLKLKEPEYLWPDQILIDLKVINITNNCSTIGIVIGLLDTTGGGLVGHSYGPVQDTDNWQTIRREWIGPRGNFVSTMIIDFPLYFEENSYVELEIQANNLRFIYNNGDTILVDPFQHIWPSDITNVPQIQIPSEFVLSQNYPNPFNPSTQIDYSLPTSGGVKLSVYNLLGQKVSTLVDSYQSIGQYAVTFDASHLASGTYMYVLSVDNKIVDKKKMLLLK